MRRFARLLFTLCSAVSLLVCVAACVLWVRSYRMLDGYSVAARLHTHVSAVQSGGRVALLVMTFNTSVYSIPSGHYSKVGGNIMTTLDAPTWRVFGFSFHAGTDSDVPPSLRYQALVIPHWAMLALAGSFLLWATTSRRARRGCSPGHCPACGYDLRTSPERCPECGTDATSTAAGQKSIPIRN